MGTCQTQPLLVREMSDASNKKNEISYTLDDILLVCGSMSVTLEPRIAYQRIAKVLVEVLGCYSAFVHILDVSGDRMNRYAAYSVEGDAALTESQLSITTGRIPRMMKDHRPIVMDYQHPHARDEIPIAAIESGRSSAVSVPLLADNRVLGIYSITFKDHKKWTPHDIEYLCVLGKLLGIAIGQVEVFKKNSVLQTMIERKRLSAEIHDNLSQSLSLIKLAAETTLISYEEGNTSAMLRDLERLQTSSDEALKILREELLSLRTSADEREGFISGIEACLLRFNDQWNVGARLVTRNIVADKCIPVSTELQLTRILHEALSNVLRHARATEVIVEVAGGESSILMKISDNGCGFDPEEISPERLGIQIMKERADTFRGEVLVCSEVEVGTTVQVRIPYSDD